MNYKREYFRTDRPSWARSGASIPKGQLLLGLEEPIEGWMPTLFRGSGEYVHVDMLVSQKELIAELNKRSKAARQGWKTRKVNALARKRRGMEY